VLSRVVAGGRIMVLLGGGASVLATVLRHGYIIGVERVCSNCELEYRVGGPLHGTSLFAVGHVE
jgi:hypothetical protein